MWADANSYPPQSSFVVVVVEWYWRDQDFDSGIVSPSPHTSLRQVKLTHSISLTGLVVLGGHTRVTSPTANFDNAFAGTTSNGYSLANALVRITFSYQGFQNAFNVAGEINNPVRTIKRSATISLTATFVLYFLCNIAYFAAGECASAYFRVCTKCQ